MRAFFDFFFAVEVRYVCSRLLGMSLAHFSKMDIDTVTPEEYMEWLDKYPVSLFSFGYLCFHVYFVEADTSYSCSFSTSFEICFLRPK